MYNIASSIKKHRLYSDFTEVRYRLARHQFVCWIAGGAVRDFCLNREVSEFDLVTDATTETLKTLFPEALLVGESFGVLKIPLAGGDFFDLTTFRQESDYFDGRRPSHVSAATPVKDSERRDFTINSLFWDSVRDVIIDYRGGLADLSMKRLICVGDPEVRFTEDFLRIIRLVRFAAQLNFEIDEATNAAAIRHCVEINNVSGERIWTELKKISTPLAWNFIIERSLFGLILQQTFGTDETKLKKVPDAVSNFFVILYLLSPDVDLSDILKERLKISNQELGEYKMIRFLMTESDKMTVEEVAYEREKSPLFARLMDVLIDSGLLSVQLGKEVGNLLKLYPTPLITPKEVLDLMPNRYIKEEMKFLRIGQFKKSCTTKGEAVEYLKKKYADKPANT